MTDTGLELTSAEPAGPLSFRVIFANRSQHTINLLDRFEPLPVFFSFAIVRADGTPVPVFRRGQDRSRASRLRLHPVFNLAKPTQRRMLELAPWLGAPSPRARYDVTVTIHPLANTARGLLRRHADEQHDLGWRWRRTMKIVGPYRSSDASEGLPS